MVEFDSVSFRHPGSPRPALEDLSFRVSPGETLAFVGPSGASANQPAATKFAMGLELHCKHFSRSALQHFSLSLAEVLTS
jgi:ABC-type microcin C transport system duplicated ATPase subunit YejF